MKKFLLSLYLLLAVSGSAYASATFECYPEYKIVVTKNTNEMTKLNKKESKKNKCIVTAKNNKYYWTTNNDLKLYKKRADNFTTFVNPYGKGYIKIKETLELPYIEHRNNGFETTTFYGSCI